MFEDHLLPGVPPDPGRAANPQGEPLEEQRSEAAMGDLTTALPDIEPHLRRIKGYRHTPVLRDVAQPGLPGKVDAMKGSVAKGHEGVAEQFQLRMRLTPGCGLFYISLKTS